MLRSEPVERMPPAMWIASTTLARLLRSTAPGLPTSPFTNTEIWRTAPRFTKASVAEYVDSICARSVSRKVPRRTPAAGIGGRSATTTEPSRPTRVRTVRLTWPRRTITSSSPVPRT